MKTKEIKTGIIIISIMLAYPLVKEYPYFFVAVFSILAAFIGVIALAFFNATND